MRFVTATGFVLDDVYVTELFYPQVFHPDQDLDRLRITWTVDIKPLAVDDILWAAFMPRCGDGAEDADQQPRQRFLQGQAAADRQRPQGRLRRR